MMQEDSFILDAPDGAKIYGIANTADSENLVILSHGLTGNPNEHHFQSARRFFNEKNYDVARFAYYTGEPGARRLKYCTLETHARDLNTVFRHFREKYANVFIAGHSYGGLTMLYAQPEARAYSFWDAAFTPSWWKDARYNEEAKAYVLDWGTDQIIGKEMYDEARSLTPDMAAAMARRVQIPSQVITASADVNKARRALLYHALDVEKELVEIPGADHTFSTGDSVFRLLDLTYDWFEKWRIAI